MRYVVVVDLHGNSVGEHIVEAPDALSAINRVEADYGLPVEISFVTVELEDGRKQNKMVVNNWLGYNFTARRLPPADR